MLDRSLGCIGHGALSGEAGNLTSNRARIVCGRNWWLVLAALLACFGRTSVAQSGPAIARSDLKPAIAAEVDARIADWLRTYQEIHANPELSLQEQKSARRIADLLRELGYQVTERIGGHGVAGLWTNGEGPTVLIRADMDALPIVEETDLPFASKVTVTRPDGHAVGVMHACGHDMHQTCLIGVAELLAQLKGQWRGRVMIVAQPAEEIGVGALAMIRDGLFQRVARPDYCLALHCSANFPAGTIAYTPGWALANVDSIDITIFGRGGHGSRPHEAIDPIVASAHVISALQTIVSRRRDPMEPAVISVGSVHAGSKHNIIPDSAQLQLTVRSYKEPTRQLLLSSIRQVTVDTCRAMGCQVEPEIRLREDEFTPATYNDPALTRKIIEVLKPIVGPERVFEIDGQMGGEDFGRFAVVAKVPGFIFWLGSVPEQRYADSRKQGGLPLPSLHSSRYAPDPQPTLSTGVRCMTAAALELLATP